MKSLLWKYCPIVACLWLICLSTVVAAPGEDNLPGPGDRIQRLERRLNELAERQEQILHRLGGAPERPAQPMPQMGMGQQVPMPMVPPNMAEARHAMAGRGMPVPALAKAQKGLHDLVGLIVLAAMICNILLAIWIFTDIRKRGEGSGIFIALALVAGIPTAIIYALVRIGDRKS